MNITNLTKLAEWLEAGGKHENMRFDMREGIVVLHPEGVDNPDPASCGTACCIAGAAVQFFQPELVQQGLETFEYDTEGGYEDYSVDNVLLPFTAVRRSAEELLGLDFDRANRLFTPNVYSGRPLSQYNDPQWAARVIRKLIATGEVDWEGTRGAQ